MSVAKDLFEYWASRTWAIARYHNKTPFRAVGGVRPDGRGYRYFYGPFRDAKATRDRRLRGNLR